MNRSLTSVAGLVCLAVFVFCRSVFAVPSDILWPDQVDNSGRVAEGAAFSVTAAPDTAYLLCPTGSKQFTGTFGGSDCWGWVDGNGVEYAIMGVADGIAFVNTTNLQTSGFVTGPASGCGGTRWRDIKTYSHYAYAVSECTGTNQGMSVIDMQYLPDSVHLVNVVSSISSVTSHNLTIDTTRGYAYLVRPGYNGFRVFSLANPVSPSELAGVTTPDLHDVFARNDTVWAAEANAQSFSVWNMANKNSPQLIARVQIPAAGYVHNIWPSGDGQHVITTEETPGKSVKYWSVADYNNVQLVSEYLAPSNLAHNAHMKGDTAYISHYESGVAVVDFSANPVQLGLYDTWGASESPNFSGAWGAYPFTPSGNIYASNMSDQLIVLEASSFITNDTLVGDTVYTDPGQKVRVDINLNNEHSIRVINIPFAWGGPLNLTADSINTHGLRTDYFDIKTFSAFDGINKRAAYSMVAQNVAPLPPGNGPVLSLYFTVPAEAPDGNNPIDLSGFLALVPEVASECFQYTVETVTPVVNVGGNANCCVGTTGNINNDAQGAITLTDLTTLVNYLFVTFQPLDCPAAANTNGDPACAITLTDLTVLVNYLFVTFVPPTDCNPACQ
jgi:choice-of-anchor B domain-containing protein